MLEKAGARLGRRVVTGHDANGQSIIASDTAPQRRVSMGPHGPHLYEVWNTRETPARVDRNDAEPPEAGLTGRSRLPDSTASYGQVPKALVSWIGWKGVPCGLV